MLWLILVALLVAAYVYRVQILSRILGQPEDRVRQMLNRRKGE